MRNKNPWMFEAPFVMEVSRVSRTTTQNTDIKDFGAGKPPSGMELGRQAKFIRDKVYKDYKNSKSPHKPNCAYLLRVFDRLFRELASALITLGNKPVDPTITRAFNTLVGGQIAIMNCLQGIPPASAEFEQMDQQLFEALFRSESINYHQPFLNLENNQQWLFELPYVNQEYYFDSEADLMIGKVFKNLWDRVAGQRPSSPPPQPSSNSAQSSSVHRTNAPSTRTRQIVEQELGNARKALMTQSEKYGKLNCYDQINRQQIFPQQDLDLQTICFNLNKSMKTLKANITRLEEELKSTK